MKKTKQECILVGCVPPARDRKAAGGSLSGRSLSRGVSVWGLSVQGVSLTETPHCEQNHTDRCKNFVAGGNK